MQNSDSVKVQLELQGELAYQLAQFIKRVGYNDCYQMTESHLTDEERMQQAYAMIYGLDAVRSALAKVGVSPR